MSQAEKVARQLLLDVGINGAPVDVEKIAEHLGIVVRFVPLDGTISGMLSRDGESDTATIGVNASHADTRQRFTIAHEIAHFCLHPGTVVIDRFKVDYRDGRSSTATDRQEIEANSFAAELLMPERQIRESVTSGSLIGSEERATANLARKFEVSSQAMRFRLQNLGLLSPA